MWRLSDEEAGSVSSVDTLDKGMLCVLGAKEQEGTKFLHGLLNSVQFKTYGFLEFSLNIFRLQLTTCHVNCEKRNC